MSTKIRSRRGPGIAPHGNVLDATMKRSRIMSPSDFLKLSNESPQDIERVDFVLPRPGELSFGGFKVKFTKPRFVVE